MAKKGLPAIEKLGRTPVEVPKGALVGAHMSIAGGTPLALARSKALGATATQIFVKNNNRWVGKVISEEEAKTFKADRAALGDHPVVAHNCYLINLASPRDDQWEKSINAMIDEVERCELLGVTELVTHPGGYLESSPEEGIERIREALKRIIEETSKVNVRILLECVAGQGTSLGRTFEELAAMLKGFRSKKRLGICIDTAHMFAAGYDLTTEKKTRDVFSQFDDLIGIDRLHALHMNDSKKALGSRVDRHEAIGEGTIGLPCFRAIMRDKRLKHIPKLLETPKGDTGENDWTNLQALVDCLK
jgi:deoxyribonuclease-4